MQRRKRQPLPSIVQIKPSEPLKLHGLHFFLPANCPSPIVVPIREGLDPAAFNLCSAHVDSHTAALEQWREKYGMSENNLKEISNYLTGDSGTLVFDSSCPEAQTGANASPTCNSDAGADGRVQRKFSETGRGNASTPTSTISRISSTVEMRQVASYADVAEEEVPLIQDAPSTGSRMSSFRENGVSVKRQGSTLKNNNLSARNDFFCGKCAPIEQGSQAAVSLAVTGTNIAVQKHYVVPLSAGSHERGVRLAALNELCVCNYECQQARNPHMVETHLVEFLGSSFDKDKQVVTIMTKREGLNLSKFVAVLTSMVTRNSDNRSATPTSAMSPAAGEHDRGRTTTPTSNEKSSFGHRSRRSTSPLLDWFAPDTDFDWKPLNDALAQNAVNVWQVPAGSPLRSNSRGASSEPPTPMSSNARQFADTTPPPLHSSTPGDNRFAPLPERIVALVAHSVLSALIYLHTNHQRVHGDVKPKNIVLSESSGCFKLCDFGSSSKFWKDGTGREVVLPTMNTASHLLLLTGAYKAPEQMSDVDDVENDEIAYGPLADVFALGLTLLELLTGTATGANERLDRLEQQDDGRCAAFPAPNCKQPDSIPGAGLVPSDVGTVEMQRLLRDMLCRNPSERHSPQSLLQRVEKTWDLAVADDRKHLFRAFVTAVLTPEKKQQLQLALELQPPPSRDLQRNAQRNRKLGSTPLYDNAGNRVSRRLNRIQQPR